MEYIGRRGYHYPHEHSAPRCAYRSSCAGQCTRLRRGGGTLVGHRNRPNTAIFSIVDGLLLRPLPYKDAERLVILWNRSPGLDITEDWFSTAQYFDIKNGHHGFEQVAIAIGGNYNLTGWGDPERVRAIRVSSNLLPMLGQQAALGRLFVADEDLPDRTSTAVLSYGTWARRFGSDPVVFGKDIMLKGVPYKLSV